MKRRQAFVVLAFWLLAVLACNLPLTPAPNSGDSFLKTLEARTPAPVEPNNVEPPINGTPQSALPIVTVEGMPTREPVGGGEIYPPVTLPTGSVLQGDTYQYVTQPGDTLAALALRFNVDLAQIPNPDGAASQSLLRAGQVLAIPNTLTDTLDSHLLLPDSEIVYSPAAADFSVADFVQRAGGFLSTYSERVDSETLSGAEIIQRVADDTSTDPRLLLAVLEYRSHWVFGQPADPQNTLYPIGFYANQYSGLSKEMTLASRQLTLGYYGWRSGKGTGLTFANGSQARLNPAVNAGTAALAYLFSKLYEPQDLQAELYSPGRFLAFYQDKFGDPWQRAAAMGPLLPDGLAQPPLELPFAKGQSWTLTGGPHAAWGVGSPWGGLDFAPAGVEKGCTVSHFWDAAASAGTVVRSGRGQVLQDLDNDGREQTGWVLLYLHVAAQDRVSAGAVLNTGDPIGHPSCEGGVSTGTHEHIARKYNGEWQAAEGPLPFVLSGWQASFGARAYSGALMREGKVVNARPDGASTSLVTH